MYKKIDYNGSYADYLYGIIGRRRRRRRRNNVIAYNKIKLVNENNNTIQNNNDKLSSNIIIAIRNRWAVAALDVSINENILSAH